jgi:predicted NUDIX family NTP pyrophosphohydrolase
MICIGPFTLACWVATAASVATILRSRAWVDGYRRGRADWEEVVRANERLVAEQRGLIAALERRVAVADVSRARLLEPGPN